MRMENGIMDEVVDMHGGEVANLDGDSGYGWEWEIYMRMGEYGIFFEIEKGVPFNDVHVFGKTKKISSKQLPFLRITSIESI